MILASHLENSFADFSDIDWDKVAANKEFAGHTEFSLRHRYNTNLKSNAQTKFKLGLDEVTMGHVTEYCRQVHGAGKGKTGAKKEERQQ